jgi:uncharacterized protein YuzE
LHDWVGAVRAVLDSERSNGAPLRATYDSTADAVYVYFTGRALDPGRKSIPLDPPTGIKAFLVMDWKDGRIVGLEVLDARGFLHDAFIASAEQLE